VSPKSARGPIGLLGGCFDPIHHGHLRPALEVFEQVGLAELRFVPVGDPPHRAKPQAPAAFRRAMVAAAIAGQPGFTVDDRELERPGPHYSVDTLASLRADLPGVPLCLLIGGDAFLGFDQWREPERILSLAHLIVMQRPGSALPQTGALGALLRAHGVRDARRLHETEAGAIHCVAVTPLEISSTQIRAALARGTSLRWLMPEAVWEMIRSSGHYQTGQER
jgi:nicotinate-nucleotide adenylyltransferase